MMLRAALALTALLAPPSAAQPLRARSDEFEPSPAQQPVFELLQVQAAWELVGEEEGCLVGVLDMGFDEFHPCLDGVLRPCYSADGVHHLSSAMVIAHGTSMASLLAARRVEEQGMVGFAPRSPLLAASMGMARHRMLVLRTRFLAEHPDADAEAWLREMNAQREELQAFGRVWIDTITRTTAEGIHALVDAGARVINYSAFVGSRTLAPYPEFAARLDEAFAYAAEHDVLLVIGAGNSGTPEPGYPGRAEQVLVVGATLLSDELWSIEVDVGGRSVRQGSCTGPRVSVVAPMENLLTARPHEEASYSFQHGPGGPEQTPFMGQYEQVEHGATSMATAVAASLAALVRTARPDLSIEEVVRIVQQTAVDLGDPGRDDRFGHGRIDFLAAVQLALELE